MTDDIVNAFISQYIKALDYYEAAARLVAASVDTDLESAGVRCIVTNRAKSISSLQDKCRRRHRQKIYITIDEIYADIVDLAGVRIALYFPSDRALVDKIVRKLFELVEEPKQFPESGKTRAGNPRFEGYSAAHYRVRLRESALSESDKRYAGANVEIQVASVLMHAWAEVEHDLVYKPTEDPLSDEEYALLDQLNGLVMSGEIALEALRKAGERRVGRADRKLKDHFELATHLATLPAIVTEEPKKDSEPGRIDRLFRLLNSLQLDTPTALDIYVDALGGHVDSRPLSDQVVDALLADDPDRYDVFSDLRRGELRNSQGDNAIDSEIGKFLNSWISFEKLTKDLTPAALRRRIFISGRDLRKRDLIDDETELKIEELRRLRNNVVHGVEPPDPRQLSIAAQELTQIVSDIRARSQRTGSESALPPSGDN